MLETFTHHTFTPHLQDTFQVSPDATATVPMTLIAVTPLGEGADDAPPAQGRQPFSLLFQSAPGTVLPQRIYAVDHAELGHFDLFLVPIATDRTGVRYEAIFT